MAAPDATQLARDTLRRIFIGATVTGVRFGVPQQEFDTAEVPGEPYVQLFAEWTLHATRPESITDAAGADDAQDDLLKSVALRHKVVEDVEVLAPWPHLLLTFGDGSVLCVQGRHEEHEAWIAGLNCPSPATRVQVIAAAVPGVVRVRDAQWASIADGLGLPLLRRRWTPLNPRDETDTADDTSSCAAAPERWLYLNSGVVLFPAGLDHRATWLDHQRRIRDHFAAHPLGAGPVTSSDQAAFATSIAAHGRFAWLPLRFNYRFGAFRLGLETAERIAIVHCTGHVDDAGLAVSARMDAYWEKHVWPRLARRSPAVADDEKARRRDIAATVLAATRALARDYDLDARLAAYRRRRG